MAEASGQLHPHYRTAAKAAGVAVFGLGAAVFAAADPADAMKAGIAAGCVLVYAGLRWGWKKLGLSGSLRGLRMPSLRRSGSAFRRTTGGGARGRSLSPFKRGGTGGKSLGGGLPRGRGRGLPGGGGKGKLPSLPRRGGKRATGTPGSAGTPRRGGLLKRGRKSKGTSGAPAKGGRRSPLRRSKGSGVSGSSTPKRRGMNPFRRAGRKGAASSPSSGSRSRLLPKLGKRSGPGGGLSLPKPGGKGRRSGASPSRRMGSLNPLKRRPGMFRRNGSAGQRRGLGILKRRGQRATATGKRSGAQAPGSGKRPGGFAAGLRRYAKASPKRPLNRWQRGALGAGKLAAAPFALAWLAGRWAWRKTRRQPQPAAQPVASAVDRPGKKQPGKKQPVPDAAPEPERSRPPVRLHNSPGGPTLMNHIDAATEAAQAHIGTWEPENAADLDGFLAALPQYFDGVATAFRTVAAKLADGYPVHPDVPDRLNEIASTIGGMADFSGEAHAAHRAQHQQEMERIENPRPNEKFWDVGAQ